MKTHRAAVGFFYLWQYRIVAENSHHLGTAGSIFATVARGLSSTQHAIYYCGGAAYSGIDIDSLDRTIHRTGTAFHAGILVDDGSFSVIDNENAMRADFHAHPAPVALLSVQGQRNYIRKIPKSGHDSLH